MPWYEYRCDKCRWNISANKPVKRRNRKLICPKCHEPMRRITGPFVDKTAAAAWRTK